MNDGEEPDNSKNGALVPRTGSSAPRVAKHRVKQMARVELLRLLLQYPEVRALANELLALDSALANVLANDRLMLANVLQQRELTALPSPKGTAPSVNRSLAPPPTTPTPGTVLASVPKPQRQSPSAPTGLTRAAAAMRGDAHWQALEGALGPCRTNPEWEQRFEAVEEFKAGGVTPQQISQIGNRWKSTMGRITMTARGMVKYAGQVLAGPQIGEHVQTLYENASVKHPRTLVDVMREKEQTGD